MFARHDLVWLRAQGWQELRCKADEAQLHAIDRWSGADWPATVRRQDADTGPGEICLGITLPRDTGRGPRTRIALRCRRSDIRRFIRPLELHAADTAIPSQWLPAWRAFQSGAADAGLDIRVFGSLAMQALTGRPYLTERSDIDLLFFPASLAQLRAGTDLFTACHGKLPLDGELIFPSGRAVAWKEWYCAFSQGARNRVLVKQMTKVSLCTVAELLAEIGEHACVN